MKDFKALLTLSIISVLCHFSINNPSYERYTSLFFDNVKIGDPSKEISLILNTVSTQSVLFTNEKRPYYQEIQKEKRTNIFKDKVSFDGHVVKSFKFNLEVDDTNLNNKAIQGELGLGIDDKNTSEFINNLYDSKLINSRAIEIDFKELEKEDKVTLNFSPNKKSFNYCNISSKRFLADDDYYHNAWIVKLSHIILGSTKKELTWDNAIEVDGHATFDSKTKYIYIPKEYMKNIEKAWNINECKLVHDSESDEKYYSCTEDIESKLNTMNSIYFVMGGYGYKLRAQDLFEHDGKKFHCLIRFYNDENNLWILGAPFLINYNLVLDYDNTKVGLNGESIINYTEEYEKYEKEIEEQKKGFFEKYTWEKVLVIIGTIVGILIIIYVMFWLYRNFRREKPKYHIELNEQYDKKEIYN